MEVLASDGGNCALGEAEDAPVSVLDFSFSAGEVIGNVSAHGFSTERQNKKTTDGGMACGSVSNIHNQVVGQIELGSKWVTLNGH